MIGIFDSGVGGLTVVKKIQERLPNLSFIYLGDNIRAPYGNYSREVIIRYAEENINFLIAHGATIIIVACNTVSALAGGYLKNKYRVPIFEVITPTIEAVAMIGSKRIGVIGTRATIASGVYQKMLEKNNYKIDVFNQSCPLFVPLIEENWIRYPETKMITRRYLTPFKKNNIDSLILGCTHYPLLKKIIQDRVGKRVYLIDPAESIVETLSKHLDKQTYVDYSGREEYFITDINGRFQEIGNRWLGKLIKIKRAEL